MNPDSASYGVMNVGMVRARERAGLTIAQAAAAMGIADKKYITLWEFQEVQPNIKTLRRMANAYGCTIEELRIGGRV